MEVEDDVLRGSVTESEDANSGDEGGAAAALAAAAAAVSTQGTIGVLLAEYERQDAEEAAAQRDGQAAEPLDADLQAQMADLRSAFSSLTDMVAASDRRRAARAAHNAELDQLLAVDPFALPSPALSLASLDDPFPLPDSVRSSTTKALCSTDSPSAAATSNSVEASMQDPFPTPEADAGRRHEAQQQAESSSHEENEARPDGRRRDGQAQLAKKAEEQLHADGKAERPPAPTVRPPGSPNGPVGRLFRSQMERAMREREARMALLEQQNRHLKAAYGRERAKSKRQNDEHAAAVAWRASVGADSSAVTSPLSVSPGPAGARPAVSQRSADSVPAMMSELSLVASQCRSMVVGGEQQQEDKELHARGTQIQVRQANTMALPNKRRAFNALHARLSQLQGRVSRFVERIETVAESKEASRSRSKSSQDRTSKPASVQSVDAREAASATKAPAPVTSPGAQEAMLSVLQAQLLKVQRSSALFEASIRADEATKQVPRHASALSPTPGNTPAVPVVDRSTAESPSKATVENRPGAHSDAGQSPRGGSYSPAASTAALMPDSSPGFFTPEPPAQARTEDHTTVQSPPQDTSTQTPPSSGKTRRRRVVEGVSGAKTVSPRRRTRPPLETALVPASARTARDVLGPRERRSPLRATSARLFDSPGGFSSPYKSPLRKRGASRRASGEALARTALQDIFWRLDMCAVSKGWRVVEVFRQFDKDRDGRLNGHEMHDMVRFLLPGATAAQARTFYVLCDFDGNGGVSYTELSRALEERRAVGFADEASERVTADDVLRRFATHIRKGPETEMFHRVFSSFGVGHITVGLKELNRLVADAMPALDSYERRLLVEDVRRKLDSKGKGRVTRDALVGAVKKAERRKPQAAKERILTPAESPASSVVPFLPRRSLKSPAHAGAESTSQLANLADPTEVRSIAGTPATTGARAAARSNSPSSAWTTEEISTPW